MVPRYESSAAERNMARDESWYHVIKTVPWVWYHGYDIMVPRVWYHGVWYHGYGTMGNIEFTMCANLTVLRNFFMLP